MNVSATASISSSQGGTASVQSCAVQREESNQILILRDSFAQNKGVFKSSAVYLKVQPMGNLPDVQPGQGALLENFKIIANSVERVELEFITGVTVIGFPMTKTVIVRMGEHELARYENTHVAMPLYTSDVKSQNLLSIQLPVLDEITSYDNGGCSSTKKLVLENERFGQIIDPEGAFRFYAVSHENVLPCPDHTAELPDGRIIFLQGLSASAAPGELDFFPNTLLIRPFLKNEWINGPAATGAGAAAETTVTRLPQFSTAQELLIHIERLPYSERNNYFNKFIDKLRNVSRGKGFITKKSLEDAASVPRGYVSNLYGNPRSHFPTSKTFELRFNRLNKIAQALNMPLLELLTV